MKSDQFKFLLEKYSRGECTPQEEKLINEWYENIESEDENVPALSEMSDDYREVLENRIWSKVSPHPPAATPTIRSSWFYPWRIAAGVAIIAVTTILLLQFNKESQPVQQAIQTPTQQAPVESATEHIINSTSGPKNVRLADGSLVILQPKSEIEFTKAFDGPLREVKLSGEAFFNVSRDEKRPFRVYSEEVVTQVLGTSFNVKAYQSDKEVTVAVKSGKVSVYAKHHSTDKKKKKVEEKAIILAPNQQAVYDRNKDLVVKEVVEHPTIILPESNLFRMSFDEAPVATIFDVLEENYGIDIVYDKETLSTCSLTTAMSDEGLFERIEVICRAINAKYIARDGVIIIDSPGCK